MARPVAILKALALAYRRDWTAFQSLAGNNFFLITAFLLRQGGHLRVPDHRAGAAVPAEHGPAAQDPAVAPRALAAGPARALAAAPRQPVDQSAHLGPRRARHLGRGPHRLGGLVGADRRTVRRRVR